MNNLLVDQVAVVTGGNAGIGKAIALKLAQEGAKVAIIGTNQMTGLATVEEIKDLIPLAECIFYQADVANAAQIEEIFKLIFETLGSINILVNNAGITADQLLMKMTEDEWDRVLDINLKSCYHTCKAVIRSMMKARQGRIINISSVIGLTGNAGQVNYAASKAGMIGFTKALAKEVAGKNILVNCIAPGFIQTKMTDKLTDTQKENILKEIPLGRMGNVEDIANAVWFLASSLSNYVTGQVLTVDGGMVM